MKKNTPLIEPLVLSVACPRLLYDVVMAFSCSRINREHIFRLVGTLLHEKGKEGHNQYDFYKPMSKSYFEIVVTDNFKKTMWGKICYNYKSNKNQVSEKEAIFQTDGNWSKKKVKKSENPMHYRINPMLMQGDLVNLSYSLRHSKDEENLNDLFPELIEHFKYSYSFLKINLNLFQKNIAEELVVFTINVDANYSLIARNTKEGEKYLEVKSIPSFFVREAKVYGQADIANVHSSFLVNKLREIRDKHRGKLEYVDDAIRIILDGPLVSIDKVDEYIEIRNERALKSAMSKAEAINEKRSRPIINPLNGRLTTPITAFNRIGIKYLSIDDCNLASFDLKSSQIVILANLMSNSDLLRKSMRKSRFPLMTKYLKCFEEVKSENYKVDEFLNYLLTNDIYLDLAEDIGIERSMAKVEVFKILFTEPGAKLSKYRIRENYPDFFAFLKEVKKAFAKEFDESKSSLSYFLQMTEAHIFLECILTSLAEEKIIAFSKHDSILISSHVDTVRRAKEIIDEQKNMLGLQGNFEKEEYSIVDWTTNSSYYNDPYYDLISSHPQLYNNGRED